MPTPGKLELTIKINEFPALVRTIESGWKQFDIDTGNQVVTISVKQKIFKKLEQAQENYPQWVAVIAGQMGEKMDSGFVLKEPNIQVFERKLKQTLEPTTVATNAASAADHPKIVATWS